MDGDSDDDQQKPAPKALVSDVVWILRGVAKAVPIKIELEKEDLQGLLQGNIEETSEDNDDDDDDEGGSGEGQQPGKSKAGGKTGLRGSATDLAEGIHKYGLEEYDDSKEAGGGPSMKGLAYYATPLEDPHITKAHDSDEEEEREDFELKPTDNLVVVAKIIKEDYSLDVYVHNEARDDWYLHHDYLLAAPPLALAAISYDPGKEDHKGNLLAVGTMDSAVQIWDLDIVNAVAPVLTLGESTLKMEKKSRKKGDGGGEGSSSSRRRKRDGTAQTHSDAVLSLDWNQQLDHILASGSADQTVILWDLDEAKASTVLNLNGMVQSLQWHPVERSVILTGTRTGQIAVTDCISEEKSASPIQWMLPSGVEVERVLWDHFHPFCAFAVSDDGYLRYLDTRRPGEFVTEVLAHEDGANGVAQSFSIRGLIATTGMESLRVWKLEGGSSLISVFTQPVNMGNVTVVRFCPDAGTILAVGAEKEDLVRIYDLSKREMVVNAFNGAEGGDEDEDEAMDDGGEE